jgi:outer membrane protein assembly factor BamB
MIHRDVKPSNVLVTASSRGLGVPFAYLVDFGIARLLPEAGGTVRTNTEGLMGTLAYAAPERFDPTLQSGDLQPLGSPAIDIYALACVLYECLVGAKPYSGEPLALMFAHTSAERPRPSERRPGVPVELDEVIVRGMAKRPADRYASAGAFAAAARAAIGVDTVPSADRVSWPDLPATPEPATGPDTPTELSELVPAPTGRGGPSRRQVLIGLTGLVGATGLGVGVWRAVGGLGAATLRWSAPTGGTVLKTPRVVGDTVYAASDDGRLYALRTADGGQRWIFPTGGALGSAPDVLGGVVYVGSDDSFLYALDAGTGVQRWRFPTGGIVHTPTVTGGLAYVGSSDKRLYAVDVLTGKQRWIFEGGNDMHSATVMGDTVYIGSSDTFLYAIDSSAGRERWRFATEGAVSGAPVVSGATVLAGSTDGRLFAVAVADGALRWRFDAATSAATPAVLAGTAFVAGTDNILTALDIATGTVRWRFQADGGLHTPLAAGDTVHVGTSGGTLYALSAATGSLRWSFAAAGALQVPALADGVVYVGSDDNRLYAIRA